MVWKSLVVLSVLVSAVALWALGSGSSGAASLPAPASTPVDVQVSNLRANGFTVSWVTADAENAHIHYGSGFACPDPSALTSVEEYRGGSSSGFRTHYVVVSSLAPDADYCYRIVYGSWAEPVTRTVHSYPTPSSPPPAGTVVTGTVSDGGGPFSGALVYAKFRRLVAGGAYEDSALLSALSTESGWRISPNDAYYPNGSRFPVAAGDQVALWAQAGVGSSAAITLTVAQAWAGQANLVLPAPASTATPTGTATRSPTTPAGPASTSTSTATFTRTRSPVPTATGTRPATATPTATRLTSTPTATTGIHPATATNLRVSNVGSSSFTVSWVSASPTTGSVLFGRGNICDNLTSVAGDERDVLVPVSRLAHSVRVTPLDPGTEYCFRAVSGGVPETSTYLARTGPLLTGFPMPGPPVSGYVRDGRGNPAPGALVYLYLRDAGGGGSTGESGLMSTYAGETGNWTAVLDNARDGLGQPFLYGSTDDLLAWAEAAEDSRSAQVLAYKVSDGVAGGVYLSVGEPVSATATASPTSSALASPGVPTPSPTHTLSAGTTLTATATGTSTASPSSTPSATVTATATRTPAGSAQMGIAPALSTVAVGDVFSVTVVISAGAVAVDGADAYLDFDPGRLQVVDSTGVVTSAVYANGPLDLVLKNTADNSAGQIGFSAGKLTGAAPSGSFSLATIYLRAAGPSSGTPLTFSFASPRQSELSSGGTSVLGPVVDGLVVVLDVAPLPVATPTPTASLTPTSTPPATPTEAWTATSTQTPGSPPTNTPVPYYLLPQPSDAGVVTGTETPAFISAPGPASSTTPDGGNGELGTAIPTPAVTQTEPPGDGTSAGFSCQGDLDLVRLLGRPLSPVLQYEGYQAQYFEKGRLEDHSAANPECPWSTQYGLLVDELVGAGAVLPVGGDTSTLTYAGLGDASCSTCRAAAPEGFTGGVAEGADGSVFVPFDSALAPADGYLVPARFWEYINRADLFPGGWLHDFGLPITGALQAVVTKGDGEERTITLQAFQRGILTDDPLNPTDWQIEQVNVGTDYQTAFPDRMPSR